MKNIVWAFSIILLLSSCEKTMVTLSGGAAKYKLKDGKCYVNGTLGRQSHRRFKKFIKKHPEVKTLVL